jgi:hypothetical protein
MSASGEVLHWSDRVVTAEALRRALNGHREIMLAPRSIITPLAADELRARGVKITRQTQTDGSAAAKAAWAYAQEWPDSLVQCAVRSLEREKLTLVPLEVRAKSPSHWARAVAETLAGGPWHGAAVFGHDAGLLACVANKVSGVRAVEVVSATQVRRALAAVGANVLVVEMPGRTLFEVGQILRALCQAGKPVCPPETAGVLEELDGHAHR